jgi:hypothetical protein
LVRPDKPRRHCERSGALVARPAREHAVLVNIMRRAIECDPGHHFGMDEVLASAAHLPNPFIRLPPGFREILQNPWAYGPAALGRRHAGLVRLKRRSAISPKTSICIDRKPRFRSAPA